MFLFMNLMSLKMSSKILTGKKKIEYFCWRLCDKMYIKLRPQWYSVIALGFISFQA